METTTIEKASAGQAAAVDLTASVSRNTLFGILASIVQIATRLVLVPIAIAHLGLDGYGIWAIVLMLANYMQIGNVGIRSAFQKYVAEATGNGNYERASALLSTGTAAMVVISVAALVPTAMFSRSIAMAAGVPSEFLQSTTRAITMLAVVMMLTSVGAPYDAILSGAHRIDLARKLSTCLCVLEAVGIILILKLGYGIFAMAAVMAALQPLYALSCLIASRRVAPHIQVGLHRVSVKVGRELLRFAGSYQLISIQEMIYGAVAPIAILRTYGAGAEGVLAVAGRLVSPVQMVLYAFVVPILSGSAMVYATGSVERMRSLLAGSFKVTLYLALLPLALISVFGTYLIAAWVGRNDPVFHPTLELLSLAMFFQSFALLGFVLYRATGRAVLDSVRGVLRIATIFVVVLFARKLGFLGVLGGMAIAELVGMIVMMSAIVRTYHVFDPRGLAREALKLATATAGIIAVGLLAAHIPLPFAISERAIAIIRVGTIGVAIMLCAFPILYFSGALTREEVRTVLGIFRGKARAAAPAQP